MDSRFVEIVTELLDVDDPDRADLARAVVTALGLPVDAPRQDDPDARLWGQPGYEYLHLDLDDVVEEYMDGRPPGEYLMGFEEHGVCRAGDEPPSGIPSAGRIAEQIAEDYADDCGFEELAADVVEAAGRADVIAAFDTARAVLVSHIGFHVSSGVIRHGWVRIVKRSDDSSPEWTWATKDTPVTGAAPGRHDIYACSLPIATCAECSREIGLTPGASS